MIDSRMLGGGHSGEKGKTEHIWQATLGSEAVVFTNHPASIAETDANLPGFWSGNAVLPKVAQWKDALIAIYNLPENDWLGFTHAYFPMHAFDEALIDGNWAFGRKGSGYVAITSGQGVELIKHGPDGYHELRSHGNRLWVRKSGVITTTYGRTDGNELADPMNRYCGARATPISLPHTALNASELSAVRAPLLFALPGRPATSAASLRSSPTTDPARPAPRPGHP